MHHELAFGYQFSNSCLQVCVDIAFEGYNEFGFLISCASLKILYVVDSYVYSFEPTIYMYFGDVFPL